MRKEKLDFIPHAYDKYVPWIQDVYRVAGENKAGEGANIAAITPAMLALFKRCGDAADASARIVRLAKDFAHAAVDYNEQLRKGITDSGSKAHHTGKISLPAFNFDGFFDKSAGQELELRTAFREIKMDKNYSEEVGKAMGIVSTDTTYDFNHDQPKIRTAQAFPDRVEVVLESKMGYDQIRFFVKRGDKGEFHALDTVNTDRIVDTHEQPAQPETWYYIAVYIVDGKMVGIPSAEASVIVKKLG